MSASDLLRGVAAIAAAAGLGDDDQQRIWTDVDTDRAIVFGDVPEVPALLLSLDTYTIRDDPAQNDSIVAVKFHMRGDDDSDSVRQLDDQLFDLFHGMHDVDVDGVRVVLMWRNSSLPMGQDQNNRWQRSANYYVRVAWPTRYRTD